MEKVDYLVTEEDYDEIEAFVGNVIYYTSLIFEKLEDAGRIRGNGHHIAQKISSYAQEQLKEHWIN